MDLNAIPALLASLGPWGVPVGIAIVFAVNWLKKRVQPSPAPSPVNPADPLPAPAPSETPLIDWFLAELRKRLARPKSVQAGEPAKDIDPAKLAALLKSADEIAGG